MNNYRGFTLIEILVSMAILAFISLYTYQSIERGARMKVKVQKDIARFSGVRDAMKVIERDVNLAFNYRDINIDLYNEMGKMHQQQAQQQKQQQPPPSGPQPPPQQQQQTQQQAKPFTPKEQKILTGFLGGPNDLNFTSLSHIRSGGDVQDSDQAEIGYFLKECRNRTNKKLQSKCLWRRDTPIIDDDLEKGTEGSGVEQVLLENVIRFELRYLGADKPEEWVKQWYTNEKGEESQRNKFPVAVEVTIETQNKHDKADKPVAMTMVAPLRFPNNEKMFEDKKDQTNQQQNPQQQQGP